MKNLGFNQSRKFLDDLMQKAKTTFEKSARSELHFYEVEEWLDRLGELAENLNRLDLTQKTPSKKTKDNQTGKKEARVKDVARS